MMYNKKFVASVKCDGKIMREHGETVYLPYGSEYSLLLKNLSYQRALVNIEIDGTNVVEGGLIVNHNQTIDLERFVINNNLSNGPKFKFIEKTDTISQHRGDKLEDGLIRVTYQFEKVYQPIQAWNFTPFNYNTRVGGNVYTSKGLVDNIHTDGAAYCCNTIYGSSSSRDVVRSFKSSVSDNENGITTYGSESNQKFTTSSVGALEDEVNVIIFNVKGDIGQTKVSQPLTVSRKLKCDVCGVVNSSKSKFCSECGTNLTY